MKEFEDACKKLGISPEDFKIAYPDALGVEFGKTAVGVIKALVIKESEKQ